jgi:16S rRNA (adenine1518-N6/adenine1519-N6)-dimethyltransferase
MERRTARTFPPVQAEFFDNLVQRGFSQRRKQLRSLLKPDAAQWTSWCTTHHLPETSRAENLTLEHWIDLSRTLDPAAAVPAQSADEPFDVVDHNDTIIARHPRSQVHANNLLHRAVHILVFNRHGEVLLQKRSAWKDRQPGKWDSSAAGHLEPDESYADAAVRETAEELGITPPLQCIGKIAACENTGQEFVEVFTADHDGPFQLPPSEIECTAFFDPQTIDEWLAARPEDFAPGFLEVWRLYRC